MIIAGEASIVDSSLTSELNSHWWFRTTFSELGAVLTGSVVLQDISFTVSSR